MTGITRRSTTVGDVIDSLFLPFDEQTLRRHLVKPEKALRAGHSGREQWCYRDRFWRDKSLLEERGCLSLVLSTETPSQKQKLGRYASKTKSRKTKNFGPLPA